MKWSEVTPNHHRKRATVSTNQPGVPLRTIGPFVGIIICHEPLTIPILEVVQEGTNQKRAMTFSGWYDVAIALSDEELKQQLELAKKERNKPDTKPPYFPNPKQWI